MDAEVAVAYRLLDALAHEDLATAFAEARVLSPSDRETGDTMTGIRREDERALAQPALLAARLDDPECPTHAELYGK